LSQFPPTRHTKRSDVPESGDDQDYKHGKTAKVHKRVVLSLLQLR
jgi:hypothetical protein